MKINESVLLMFIVIALAGCTEAIDVPLSSKAVVYFSEDNNKQIELTSKDKAYVDLSTWLREHRSDWYTTSGKYSGGVYLKTGNYGVQIKERQVVLYSTQYESPRAMYIQDIQVDDLLEMKNLGK